MSVTYELDGNIALVGLNRPEKRNALNHELLRQLREAILRAGDEAVVGVLFGHGRNFSSGLDLAELAARLATPESTGHRGPQIWHATFNLVSRGRIPFVAAVHGPTIGGGLELAAAAHIRVGDETAVFGLPEGQRGIFLGGGGTVNIQRIVGYETIADMMLTGRILTADEARQAKLLQYLVGPGLALDKARELAARIAQNTSLTNWQITNVLPRIGELPHDQGLFVEEMASSMAKTPETLNRLRAFLEKRSIRLIPPHAS